MSHVESEVPVLETSKGCIFSSGAIARWGIPTESWNTPIGRPDDPDDPDDPDGPGISHESVDRLGYMVKTSLRQRIRIVRLVRIVVPQLFCIGMMA